MPVPRYRARARSIVPSPPSTTTMSASSLSTSSTPHRSATERSCASAPPTPSRSIVITAARLTDGIRDPAVEVGRPLGVLAVDEVENELTVSLRAGETGVYDPARLRSKGEQRVRDLGDHAAPDDRVAHDALRRLGPTRLELRLHEHERLPPRRSERERRRKRELRRDERDVARDESRRERQLRQGTRVHALEHDDAWVVPDLRVQLAVADVERDHPPRAALQQHVGE